MTQEEFKKYGDRIKVKLDDLIKFYEKDGERAPAHAKLRLSRDLKTTKQSIFNWLKKPNSMLVRNAERIEELHRKLITKEG